MLDYTKLTQQADKLFDSFTKESLEEWIEFDNKRMNKLEKSRMLLQKYLRETPPEVLQEKFDKYNAMTPKNGVRIHPLFFKGDFVDVAINGIISESVMSKYALLVGNNKWRIDKSFIDLTKLENKLNVKFKIIEND